MTSWALREKLSACPKVICRIGIFIMFGNEVKFSPLNNTLEQVNSSCLIQYSRHRLLILIIVHPKPLWLPILCSCFPFVHSSWTSHLCEQTKKPPLPEWFLTTFPTNQYPSFCTRFGLILSSVVGMGKMRRVGSLLVLKIQGSYHLPKRIRSFLLLQPSRASPSLCLHRLLTWTPLICNLLFPLILHQIGVDVQFRGGDGENAACGARVDFAGPGLPLVKAPKIYCKSIFLI